MSKKADRHKRLLQIINEHGMLPVKSLADMLNASGMTVYRDINELRAENKLPNVFDHVEAADRRPNVYLSGPEIFYANYETVLAEKLRLCGEYGFMGLPNENTSLTPPYDDADLFANIISLLDRCDIIIANLEGFRGPEPDSGVVWECAYGVCNKKRVYGYCSHTDMTAAVAERYSPVTWQENHGVSTPFDKDGNRIENWGKPLNLMLTHSIILVQGCFEDALKLVARDYSNHFWR